MKKGKKGKPILSYQPDDTLKPVKGQSDDLPQIFKIKKRGKSINRKDFLKTAAAFGGLAALGSLLQGCEESELDIKKSGSNCTCHAVCSCDNELVDGEKQENSAYDYTYYNNICTCNSVCTCDTVCTCNEVCTCDSESSGGGGGSYYTYWYPN
jgi:hypothetical protein